MDDFIVSDDARKGAECQFLSAHWVYGDVIRVFKEELVNCSVSYVQLPPHDGITDATALVAACIIGHPATVEALVDHLTGLLAPQGDGADRSHETAVDALESMTDDEAEAALLAELQDLTG